MFPRQTAFLAVAVGLTLGHAGTSRAFDQDSDLKEATRLMHEGKREGDAGHYEAARQLYAKACALAPTPRCLRSLANNELRTGRLVDALHHFRQELAHPKVSVDVPADGVELDRRQMQDAYAATGHLDVRAPEGATITLDGQVVADAASHERMFDVLPGLHAVEVRAADQGARAEVTAAAGSVVPVDLQPPKRADVAAPAPVPPSSTAPPVAAPTEDGPTRWWTTSHTAGVIAAGAGVAAIAVSGVFAGQAHRAADAAAGLRPCVAACASLRDEDSTQARAKTFDLVFFATGIAAVATGAVLVLWPSSSVHQTVAPLAAPNAAGLQYRGEF